MAGPHKILTMKEFNTLCAKFLGATVEQAYANNPKVGQSGLIFTFPKEVAPKLGLFTTYSLESLKFDSDWNWLMLVIEKLENEGWIAAINSTITIIRESADKATIHDRGCFKTEGSRLKRTIDTIFEILQNLDDGTTC